MWDDHEVLKLRVLQFFLKGEEEYHTVVKIAKVLNVTKQRVSRMLIELEKEGVIDRENTRQPKLTQKGVEVAEYYAKRIKMSLNHLLYEGVSIENAEQDAYYWAIYNSDDTMKVIGDAAKRCEVKYRLRNLKHFNGDVLCKQLGDGVYRINFVILKEQTKNGTNISMANDGFEHPCNMVVENGVGKIQLRIINVDSKLYFEDMKMVGKVTGVMYKENRHYISAEINDDMVTFPASVLTFTNIGENIDQMLLGSVSLKMKCHLQNYEMPESIAVFNVFM